MNSIEKTEMLDLCGTKIKTKIDKKKLFLRTIPILLMPFLLVLTIISLHSKRLIITPISYTVYILLSLCLYLFISGLFIIKKRKKKKRKIFSIVFKIFITFYIIGCLSFTFMLYGPINNFRNWLISTSMSTMNHNYICKWFYSEKEISKVLNSNYIVEVDEETDTNLIKMEEEVAYANEYEKAILKRDKDAPYKIIELEVNGQKAYLAAIYDPSKVKVATSKGVGKSGQYATKIAEQNNAILATNGGGFGNAYGDTTGGVPTGVTIVNGKIISDNIYGTNVQNGGLIGMTYDNKLVMIKNATGKKLCKPEYETEYLGDHS